MSNITVIDCSPQGQIDTYMLIVTMIFTLINTVVSGFAFKFKLCCGEVRFLGKESKFSPPVVPESIAHQHTKPHGPGTQDECKQHTIDINSPSSDSAPTTPTESTPSDSPPSITTVVVGNSKIIRSKSPNPTVKTDNPKNHEENTKYRLSVEEYKRLRRLSREVIVYREDKEDKKHITRSHDALADIVNVSTNKSADPSIYGVGVGAGSGTTSSDSPTSGSSSGNMKTNSSSDTTDVSPKSQTSSPSELGIELNLNSKHNKRKKQIKSVISDDSPIDSDVLVMAPPRSKTPEKPNMFENTFVGAPAHTGYYKTQTDSGNSTENIIIKIDSPKNSQVFSNTESDGLNEPRIERPHSKRLSATYKHS